jgi:uncharacterized membrane protein YccC
MTLASPWNRLNRLFEDQSLQPDLGRAIRATLGYMVPLLLAAAGRLPFEATFVALVAQNVAMVDVRGAYAVRLGLLLAMTAILSGAVLLGTLVSPHLLTAVLGMGLMALGGGLWRHLSSDYGIPLATASILVYLLGASAPASPGLAVQHAVAALAGGLWGLMLQVVNWPFRPQHPLRRAVADSWLAVADLFEAMAPSEEVREAERVQRVAEREAALRTTLDKSYAVLAAAGAARTGAMLARLERLNLAAARLATRVVAFNTAFETLMAQAEFAALLPSFLPALTSLTNTSRTMALAVVSRQPEHLATADVRLLRLSALLRVLQTRVTAQTPATLARGQLLEILRQIERHLPEVRDALRATITRAGERAAFSLELLDVHTWSLRPLASVLNLRARVDPALIRFSIRLAVFTMLGVVIFKAIGLPHGYWLPFTMVVVLQPDYGSTRQRAAQRLAGTLAGSIVASLLLWLHLPFPALTLATAATIFTFGFLVKRNYGLAVFFVTLFIVLLTEANGPVTIAFTGERLGSTLAGGAISLLAALFFWPVWERDRFPPVFAQALRSNRDYLRLLTARLASGGSYDAEAIAAKRRAETANSAVFSSLQRMIGDPRNQREGIERAAALANGNQRLTRALTVVTLHLTPGRPLAWPEIGRFAQLAADVLDALAEGIEAGAARDERLDPLLRTLEEFRFPTPSSAPFAHSAEADAQRDHWVFTQLSRAATELSAMLLAAKSEPVEDPPESATRAA